MVVQFRTSPSSFLNMSIASVAQTGFAASSAYDTYRPSYPTAAVDHFLKVLEIEAKEGARILDLGAGTGKFTVALSVRQENYKITAVEPHDGMRAELQQKQLQNVTVWKGTAESIDMVSDQSCDAVTVAQAFHWMSNMGTLKEIHRILKPAAVLGMIWNIENYNAPTSWEIHEGWETIMRDVLHKLKDDHPRYRDMEWKNIFDEQGSGNPFTIHQSDPLFSLPVGEASFDFVRWLSKEDVWKTFKTYSQIANLNEQQLSEVEETFWSAINSEQTELDGLGRVAVYGKTVMSWTSSIPNEPLGTNK